MKKLSTTLILCFVYGTLCLAQTTSLSYRFSYQMSGDKPQLHVQLTCRGTDSGVTYLQLPDKFANQNDFYKTVSNLTVDSKNATLEDTDDPSVKRLRHKRRKTLSISYTLTQDWTGELTYPKNFRGVIQPDFVQFTGYALLAMPKADSLHTVEVSLNWDNMPSAWTIGNSLHAGSRQYKGVLKQSDLSNSLFVAGDFRLHKTLVQGKPIFVAIRGNSWTFQDSSLVNAIGKVIKAERDFWHDHNEPYYFVSLIPFASQGSYNGTALHQSFMLAMTNEFNLDINVYGLLSHEYFHRWNGVEIIMKGDEQENTWIGEGFTEYYTYKLLHRGGIISLQEYVGKTNSTISDYYLSPVRNANKQEMGKNYWKSRDFQLLPYKKGFTYALYLEQLLRKKSKGQYSLDDVMFELRATAQKSQPITEALFIQIVNRLTGEDITADHQKYIADGATIPVEKGSMGQHIADTLVSIAPFELGFNYDASIQAKKVIGVTENSAAWAAGLRNDQTILGVSIYFGNIDVPVDIHIETEGQKKKISYLPMSAQKQTVRHFKVE
ncbi:MAG: hypothetical protein JNL70_18015 [Saprospiraceae bacterium]|nr:hypothetical protein [Saprospiraceae bacterium]